MMGPWEEELIIYDIDPDIMTDLEKEIAYDEIIEEDDEYFEDADY